MNALSFCFLLLLLLENPYFLMLNLNKNQFSLQYIPILIVT